MTKAAGEYSTRGKQAGGRALQRRADGGSIQAAGSAAARVAPPTRLTEGPSRIAARARVLARIPGTPVALPETAGQIQTKALVGLGRTEGGARTGGCPPARRHHALARRPARSYLGGEQ